MTVDADAELLKALLDLGSRLVVVRPLGDDNRADEQATLAELVDLAQDLVIVGGAHVGADLAAREILALTATMISTSSAAHAACVPCCRA